MMVIAPSTSKSSLSYRCYQPVSDSGRPISNRPANSLTETFPSMTDAFPFLPFLSIPREPTTPCNAALATPTWKASRKNRPDRANDPIREEAHARVAKHFSSRSPCSSQNHTGRGSGPSSRSRARICSRKLVLRL